MHKHKWYSEPYNPSPEQSRRDIEEFLQWLAYQQARHEFRRRTVVKRP